MSNSADGPFSRRERDIMDALHRLRAASAFDVARELKDPDHYHAIRVTLRKLEKKGFISHRQEGRMHLYHPTVSEEAARRRAIAHVTRTFFGGSPSSAILAFLDLSRDELSDEELAEIANRIEDAGQEKG